MFVFVFVFVLVFVLSFSRPLSATLATLADIPDTDADMDDADADMDYADAGMPDRALDTPLFHFPSYLQFITQLD